MRIFLALALAFVLGGCSKSDETPTGSGTSQTTSSTRTSETTSSTTSGESTATTSGETTGTSSTASSTEEKPPVDRMPKDGEEVAVMETDRGRIVLMFFPDKAPGHVKNFKKLISQGFYNGTKFHRVIPGFMIQGGDPNTKSGDPSTFGGGGPDYTIKGEMNDIPHKRGILSMARTGAGPDTAGSQFFLVVADSFFLNPTRDANGKPVPGQEGYTVFGQVLSGMDVADKIVSVPTVGGQGPDKDMPTDLPVLKSVKLAKWPVK